VVGKDEATQRDQKTLYRLCRLSNEDNYSSSLSVSYSSAESSPAPDVLVEAVRLLPLSRLFRGLESSSRTISTTNWTPVPSPEIPPSVALGCQGISLLGYEVASRNFHHCSGGNDERTISSWTAASPVEDDGGEIGSSPMKSSEGIK